MGTSKGYIAPTRIDWSNSKRAVTQMLRDGSTASVTKAASKFATAMKTDTADGSVFSKAVSGILGLSRNINDHGLNHALNQINRPDLIGKSSSEIWSELFNEYTNNSATVEDSLAADALSKSLSNLDIEDIEQLGDISQEVLLKELLSNFISINFDFRYAEKIAKDRTPAEAHRIMKEMQDYIRSVIYERLNIDDIGSVDFTKLSNSQYIDKALKEAYSIFEDLYAED